MTPEREAEIQSLREGTTPGPWKMVRHWDALYTVADCGSTEDGILRCVATPGRTLPIAVEPNARFIAQSPVIVDELLAEAERLRGKVDVCAYWKGRNDVMCGASDCLACVLEQRDEARREVERLRSSLSSLRGEREAAICTGVWAVIVPAGGVLVRNGPDGGELMIYGWEVEARAKLPKGCTLERVDVSPAARSSRGGPET